MKQKVLLLSIIITTALTLSGLFAFRGVEDGRMVSINVPANAVCFYWKDDQGKVIGSLGNLKSYTQRKGQQLVFAMNGGMYLEDQSPQGLYIEEGRMIRPLNTANSSFGNFYMNPNGVFCITTDHKATICTRANFRADKRVRFATQSGPMMVIDGQINPLFKQGSENTNIRNGVGILPDQTLVFAMSKNKISFYDFAAYFKALGCKQALYLDGFISRTYYPAQKWEQLDGGFGVMIGVLSIK